MNPKYFVLGFVALGIILAVSKFINTDRDAQIANSNASGAAIVSVQVPILSGKAKAGEALFNANCASCHGTNAVGQEGVAPPLVHKIYEPSHHGDASFLLAAQNGVRAHHWPFGNMPPVKDVSRHEVAQITNYVRELQRANGIF